MLSPLSRSHQGLVGAQAAGAYAILVFVCMVVGASAASAGQENKCTAEGTEVQVTVGVTSKTVSFICESTVPDLLPAKKADDPNFDQCYDEKACNTPKDFSAVVGADVGLAVAGPVAANPDQKYTVTVQKLPKEAKTVFFVCSSKKASALPKVDSLPDKKCIVALTIPAKPPAD
ncbi:sag-related sequence srs53f, partial [Cystoisospora suis]